MSEPFANVIADVIACLVDDLVVNTMFDFDRFISGLVMQGLAERRRKRRS